MPKKNILIADDEEDIRKLLVRVLKSEGYRFFLAENGKEAVDIAKNNPIDLALLDIKMPLLDGQETLKRIKKIDQTIEVIMLTGYGNLESLKEMIVEHGAYDYLSKPMDMENIKHCIKNALEKRELRRRRNVEKQELQDRVSQMERDFKEQTYKLRESQIRYRNIVENANDAIVVSQEGYLRFANGIALELSGYTREEILKIPFLEIIHPDDRETVNETYIRRLSGEDVAPFDLFRVLRKDGTFFWVENHAVKTMFEDKPCVLNILRDITERIEAEQELRESEHRYRGIFEQATDSIVVLDLQTGVIVDFNDSAHENLGYTREEFSGLKISDIEALESPAAVRKRSKKFIKDKQAEFETRHRKKDGQVRDIDVRARVISLGGKEYGFAIWRDITNEKKYQETMKIKDAALATAFNGVALADLEGNLTYANKAFVEMWGYAEEGEIIGMSAQRIVNMDARAMEALDELRDKGSWVGQITAVRKDGSSFDVQVSANAVRDEANQPICLMGSFLDITKQKRAEELISRSEKLTSLGQLSAGLAHELRNPLAVISTCSQFCVENMKLERPAIENFQVIRRNAQRASNLINELLNFARPSQLDWVEVDINEVVGRVLDVVRFERKSFHIALVPMLRKRLPKVLGDGGALRQVFLNLTQNAIQAVSEKGEITLETRFLASRGEVEVNVIDNGPGIPADYRTRVFDPFFTTKDRGTGLGLSICHTIVKQHKGSILLGSGDGDGTKVSVRLPVYRSRRGE